MPTGKYIKGQVGTGQPLVLGYGLGVTGDNNWGIGLFGADGATPTSPGIGTGGGNIYHNVPTGSTHRMIFGGVVGYNFSAALCEFSRLSLGGTIGSSVDPGAGGLSLTNRLLFSGDGTADPTKNQIYAAGNSLYYNCQAGSHRLYVAGAQRFYCGDSISELRTSLGGVLTVNANVEGGGGAIATGATSGFFGIPSSAGAPTGAPTTTAGIIPIHIDSTNSRLYAYISGAWKSILLV